MGKGCFKVIAFVANFKHQDCVFAHVCGRVAQQLTDEIHAVVATGQRKRWLSLELSGQAGHALAVYIRRVAQNQIKQSLGLMQSIRHGQRHARMQAMAFDVDARHIQRVL